MPTVRATMRHSHQCRVRQRRSPRKRSTTARRTWRSGRRSHKRPDAPGRVRTVPASGPVRASRLASSDLLLPARSIAAPQLRHGDWSSLFFVAGLSPGVLAAGGHTALGTRCGDLVLVARGVLALARESITEMGVETAKALDSFWRGTKAPLRPADAKAAALAAASAQVGLHSGR